ncbi:MAG: hypothetical protein ACYC1U_07840 [Candidatus Aquicultorales bacterium]
METISAVNAGLGARAKVLAAAYPLVAFLALIYALFSPDVQLHWTLILLSAVACCVVLGAWFSYRASEELLPVVMPLNIFAFIALALELALIAPQEQILGGYIRLIYIHAAVTWVGLILFVAAFVAGVVYLVAPRLVKVNWAEAVFGNAMFFWAASTVIGTIAAYLTWGDAWYMEPRTRMALIILVLALVAFISGPMVQNDKLRIGMQAAVPVVVYLLLLVTGKLVHPNNAFVKSDSIELKLFALIITIVFAGVAAQGIRWLAHTRTSRSA